MIIKSMSRKSKSFSQLYDYLTRDQNDFSFTRNLYSNPKDRNKLLYEFISNSKFLENSRGKNYLYHEVLSLEQNNLSLEKQKEILFDLANKYLDIRALNHLSFGVIHLDKDNIHLHLMISANEIEGQKRIRLSKKEFGFIQKEIESYKNLKYKELSKTRLYQKEKVLAKDKQTEQEIKHKRNAKTKKEQIRELLESILNKASSSKYLENSLLNNGFEIYKRGQTLGVIYEKKKYRLKTLGLEALYISKTKEFENIKQRETRREKQKADRSFSRDNSRTRWKDRLNRITKRELTKSKK